MVGQSFHELGPQTTPEVCKTAERSETGSTSQALSFLCPTQMPKDFNNAQTSHAAITIFNGLWRKARRSLR